MSEQPADWRDRVPILVDGDVALRAAVPADVPAIVEQCRDPESIAWTTIPTPYDQDMARAFIDATAAGWEAGTTLTWTIEAPVAGRRQYCGSIDLRGIADGAADIGFVAHPAARGHGYLTAAARLVVDYGFQGPPRLAAIRWRAIVGNWGSRRIAAKLGFRFEGTQRRGVSQRGELRDSWTATLLANDPRVSRAWRPRMTLAGELLDGSGFTLRGFTEADVPRLVQAAADPAIRAWRPLLPDPVRVEDGTAFVLQTHEAWADGTAGIWCIADESDTCVGGIEITRLKNLAGRLELAYWVHPDRRNRGQASAAVDVLTRFIREHGVGHTLLIRIAEGNLASARVAERCGFAPTGSWPEAELSGTGKRVDLLFFTRLATE